MEQKNLTVEDIERKQRLLARLFKIFIAILILICCIFIGWLISFVGYADELHSLSLQSDRANFHFLEYPEHVV